MSVGCQWNGSLLTGENRRTWGTYSFFSVTSSAKTPYKFGCRYEMMMSLTAKNVVVADFTVLSRHWQNV